DLWKVNYSKAYYDVDISLLPTHNNHGIQLKAASKRKDGSIRIQGKNLKPTRYNKPITLTKSEIISVSYNKGSQAITKSTFTLNFNKATGKKASISTPPNERYPGQPGAFSLVNGIYSNKGLSSPDWLGWIGDDLEATIDLGRLTSFSSVRMHTLDQNGSWIYLPEYVEVFTSKDGKNFRQAGRSTQFIKDTLTMGWITVSFPKTTSRYIKLVAKNKGMIGEGLPGAGNKAWLFADEIQAY
ncbi:MAG TPA: discoidin domain-containing protein, partial [Flavisolibacter sp.]|nr:discoidin domain-containing protein [Flavisolibacter sp.]